MLFCDIAKRQKVKEGFDFFESIFSINKSSQMYRCYILCAKSVKSLYLIIYGNSTLTNGILVYPGTKK